MSLFQINKIVQKVVNSLYIYNLKSKNLSIGENVVFKNKTIFQIHNRAYVRIGDNVTLNSKNAGYHLNLFAPCKIMADAEDSKIFIGDNTRIHGTCIHAQNQITIGKNCLIAANSQILDSNGHDLSYKNPSLRIKTTDTPKYVIIEDNVWICEGVVVLPGVKIGNGSIISARSVVDKDIPPGVIAGGNPVKILKHFSSGQK